MKILINDIKVANYALKYLVVSLLVQLDGGEALDFSVLKFVGCRVHLGDDDGFVVLVLHGQLFVDRNQLLAVTAPRHVEKPDQQVGTTS